MSGRGGRSGSSSRVPMRPRWSRRRVVWFFGVFAGVLVGGWAVLSLRWVDARVVQPWTGWVAVVAARVLEQSGEEVVRVGTVIRGEEFAVRIENGCNGLEAVLIFVAGVVAFPARWRWKVAGLVVGVAALQVVNLVRVVTLYWTGVLWPGVFDTAHTVVWQTGVVLVALTYWGAWVQWVVLRRG